MTEVLQQIAPAAPKLMQITIYCKDLATWIRITDTSSGAVVGGYEILRRVDPVDVARGIQRKLDWMVHACVVHAGSETQAELETEAPIDRINDAIEWYLQTNPACCAYRSTYIGEVA